MGPEEKSRCDCVFSRLNKDGESCERYTSFLAYASGQKIEFTTTFDEQHDYANITFNSELNRREVQALKPIQSLVKAPVAVVADTQRKLLFISDIQTEQIVAISFDQSKRVVLTQNIRQVEGVAYDEKNKNLYFSSNKAIQRINVENVNEKTQIQMPIIILELDKGDLIRGIAVNPCESTIYFTNWRLDKPAIEQVFFNGSNRQAIVTKDIQTPNSISIDFVARKLYWIDARLGMCFYLTAKDLFFYQRKVMNNAQINNLYF
jgi:integrin beta 2